MKSLLTVSLLGLLCGGLATAQEFRATISGYVFDGSGAAVPNAKIEAVNLANSETTNATSDNGGAYTLPFLRPGDYKITASAQGFKQTVREKVNLEVGRIVGINLTLEVGNLTESVTISGEAALLETQTASRVSVVNTTQVSELPLNSRNPFMLGSMMSGVNFRGAAIWQRPFDNGAIAQWSVNGGRESNNEFLMDGAPNNAQMGGNNIAYVPIVDAVQEFSIQQNSYDAQYGKTGGGVFNVVLKSGSNDFHAVGWEFARRKWLDANTFQNNSVGAARPGHKLDQYGFQLDGPVFIPKLLKKDGKVRLFYLGSFENYRELWPQFLRNSYPEPEMRNGDFSRLVTATNQPITIYDPVPTGFDASNNPIRAPFPGNVIPANRIHPVARAVTQFMPAPNAKTAGQRYSIQNLLNPEYPAQDKFYNLILKFDWQFGDSNRAFFRHASNDRTENRCVNGICEGPGMDGQQPFQRINDAYVLDWLTTISPTTVLNVRASSNRFIEKGFGRGNEGFDLTKLGLSTGLLSQLPSPVYFGRWNFNNGYSPLGRAQSNNFTNTYNLAANLTKIAGAHTLKMGIDIRRMHWIQQNTGDILSFTGETRWTQRLWNQGEATSGDGYASFLLGGVGGSSNYPLFPFFRQWYVAPYLQDDWKVSRRVTVNLGLRWDFNQHPDEKYNRLNRGFNATAASPIAQQISAANLALYPQLRNLKGGLEFAGVNGNPRTTAKMDWNNIQPRVGIAYSWNDKTVIRGGYGLYYTNFSNNNDWNQTTGFSTSTPLVNTEDEGRTLRPNLLGSPYTTINSPIGSSRGYNTFVGQNYGWFNPEMTLPYVHQFSFGIQRQLSQNSTLDVSYVGSRSVGLNTEKDFNIPSLDFRKQCNFSEGGNPNFCNDLVPNPFRGIEAFRGTTYFTAANVSRFDINRPFPQFTGTLIERGRNESNIWYNSLQVNYNMRVGRSLTLGGNYTLSKMVERAGYLDPYANVMQQGLYFSDRPHFFKFNTVWELPFGKGRMFGGNMSSWADKIVGGWQLSTFTQTSSGEPTDLPGGLIPLKDPRTVGGSWTGSVDWKAHQVRAYNNCVLRQFNDGRVEPQAYSIQAGCGTNQSNYVWFQPAAYTPRVTPFRSGQIRKQRMFNIDLSVSKNIQVTERLRVQFRAEAFNATNYFFFGRNESFITDPNNPNFGSMFPNQANTQNGYPRQVQLGIKVYW